MERRPLLAKLWGLGFKEHTVSRIEESQILCVTAITLGDSEEHETLASPKHFKTNHIFIEPVHRLQVHERGLTLRLVL